MPASTIQPNPNIYTYPPRMDKDIIGKLDDDAMDDIERSAKKHGIDKDFLAAIILRESSGDWGKSRVSVHIHSINSRIHPYIGLTQWVANKHGINFTAIEGDRSGQIDALAKILHNMFTECINSMVARMWYTGDPGLRIDSRSIVEYVDETIEIVNALKEK